MRTSRSLESVFLEHANAPPATPGALSLEAALRGSWEAGHSAWPDVEIGGEAFARFLGERSLDPTQLSNALSGDLYLACACAQGVPGAIETFERAFGPDIGRIVARRGVSRDIADEAGQRLRIKLFSRPDGQPPRIAEYGGRAPLKNWLAAVATREVLMTLRTTQRREQHEIALEQAVDGAGHGGDFEIEYLKTRYKGEFDAALKEAIERVSDRERTLLHLHYGNGFSIDRLAAVYQVGRSTVARWLAAARARLREGTRCALCERLRLSESEYGSIARLVRSQLEVSAVRLLRPQDGA